MGLESRRGCWWRLDKTISAATVLAVIVVRSIPMENTLTLASDVQFWEYGRSNSE